LSKKKNILESRQEKSGNKDIINLLLPSLLSIILCMFFMASSTWAYFISSIPSSQHKIEAANFDVLVEMSLLENDNSISVPEENGKYHVENNRRYSVTLTAQGTAATGYCIMFLHFDETATSNKYYTNQISKEESMTFFLEFDKSIYCSFVPSWGTYSGTCDVSNGDTLTLSLTI